MKQRFKCQEINNSNNSEQVLEEYSITWWTVGLLTSRSREGEGMFRRYTQKVFSCVD
jgi:hypothetical protein